MKKLMVFIILTLTSFICFTACTPQETVSSISENSEPQETTLSSNTQEDIDTILKQTGYKGIVYLSCEDNIIYNNSFGKSNKTTSAVNTADTEFCIASNTKQFTAAAIMLLQQNNKLSVNDTIDKFFPEYNEGKNLTIHHLLTMRSGIPDYIAYTDENGNRIAVTDSMLEYKISEDSAPEDNRKIITQWILKQPLNFEPDEKFEYSNSNYFLLAEIIEQASVTTYEDFIQANIFEPLAMKNSSFIDTFDRDSKMFAQPNNNVYGMEYLNYPGVTFGAGNIISTANDINKWLNEFSENKILSKDSLTVMTANCSKNSDMINYGYGLMISDDGKSFYHIGNLPSYDSMFFTNPEKHTNLILMSNYTFSGIETLGKRLIRDFSEVSE